MRRNKHTRKVISGKLQNIAEHERKIETELEKPNPNRQLIAKWEKDIRGFEGEIAKYSQRLPGGKT